MGAVVLSIDADRTISNGAAGIQIETHADGRQQLADLLDTRRLPATWVVTRRTLDGHGPDGVFLDRLRTSTTGHELACQPFVPGALYDRRAARDAASACVNAAYDNGFRLTTVAFADDRPVHRTALSECGFCCYRGDRPDRDPMGRLRRLARVVRRDAPPIVWPATDDYGLVVVPTSTTPFRGALGLDHRFDDRTIDRLLAGIDAATETDGVLHVRLPTSVLIDGTARSIVRPVLDRIVERRDAGELDVETVHGVATWIHSHSPSQPIDAALG